MNKNQSFDDFRGRDKNRTKNIKRDRRKCWEDWWRNGWRAARSAKKHRKRYDFWRARRPRVFAFLLLSFDNTITRLFKARRKLWWLLSVPSHRVGMDPNASTSSLFFYSFFWMHLMREKKRIDIIIQTLSLTRRHHRSTSSSTMSRKEWSVSFVAK